MMSTMLKVVTLAFVVTLCQGQSQDATLTPGAFGVHVVNSVISRIRSKCVFSEDRLFLRRSAYVMSRDGQDSRTYRSGFYGGIWQVTEPMLQATQNCALPSLAPACNNISAELGIQWETVQWSDLRKPLYSGLAAALAALRTLGSSPMPGDVAAQAALWASVYGESSGDTFGGDAVSTPIFQCKDKLDLAFLLDSSGSVSYSDYVLMKNFTASVVDVMDVSLDGVRIADVIYASSVEVAFNFDTYSTKSQVKSNLLNAAKIGGGTNTAGGLDRTRLLFQPRYGERPEVKNVVVLVTDGRSSNALATVTAAKRLKDSGVTVFAVGVGNYVLKELQDVASDPICSHVLTLTDFSQIHSIITEIQKSACEANYKASEGTAVVGEIGEDGDEKTIETPVPGPDKTIEASVTCGILHIYASTTDPKPGPAVFDNLYTATPDRPALLTLVDTAGQGTPVYITVVGTRLPSSEAQLRQCSDYNWTLAPVPKKIVKVICEEDGKQRDCTDQDLTSAGLCSNNFNYTVENPCTKENLDKGVTRFPYPYDPFKFVQCDKQGSYYITLCPGGVTFNTQTRECGFTSPGSYPLESNSGGEGGSVSKEPEDVVPVTSAPVVGIASKCTSDSLAKGQYYHPYESDKTKFVQCDAWGTAYIMDCAPGTQWSQTHYTCIHATTTSSRRSPTPSPVTAPSPSASTSANANSCAHNELYPKPCEPTKFDICDHGVLKEKTCPDGLVYNHPIKACDWTWNVPGTIPAYCP